jgi:hypothetical protein
VNRKPAVSAEPVHKASKDLFNRNLLQVLIRSIWLVNADNELRGSVQLFLISRFAYVNQRAIDVISAEIIKRESNLVLLSPYS